VEAMPCLIGRLNHAFSILRIFAGFRMLGLPMPLLRRGSEGAEPQPEAKANDGKAPTQMFEGLTTTVMSA